MTIEVTYQEMSYIRSLLHRDNPQSDSIDRDLRKVLLAKLLRLEKSYVAKLNS